MDRDALTGLPDRHTFFKRVEGQIKCCGQFDDTLGIVVVNLRRFRDVNREYGYRVGDALLVEVAQRIQSVLRQSDTVARVGADEFALLLPGLVNPGHAQLAAHKIDQVLSEPFSIRGLQLRLRSYCGVALFPQHAADSQGLMQAVDRALVEARESGAACEVFATEMKAAKPSLLALESDLRDAIEGNELRLYLQPQMDLERSQVHGFECLARWLHPQRGNISPADFIMLAEQTGQIESLTRWSLRTGLHHLKMLRHLQPDLSISVNLTPRMLYHPELPDILKQCISTSKQAPEGLIVEITEHAILLQPEVCANIIRSIHKLGIGVSIDDFGTGFSSLPYLNNLRLREIKIDRLFIRDLGKDKNDEKVVRSMILLAHNFDMRVTAEGIENQMALERLADMGCDLVQGDHIAPALRADDAAAWMGNPNSVESVPLPEQLPNTLTGSK